MSQSAPRRVLIVDDDPMIREVLRTMLSFEGCDVRTAADGESSLAAAEQAPPDVVVLDVMMPGISGLEVCRRLKAASESPRIVMVSGKGSREDRVRGMSAGADAYIAKPFSPVELLDAVGVCEGAA